MEFKRKAYQQLLEWKGGQNRKPLILRGARQVGKTTLVRQFSHEYKNFIEVNLERNENRNLFESVRDISKILDILFLKNGISGNDGSTLIFIDEIQESPEAIKLLRFFYEDFPAIHVIAAGSLLEFALNEVSSFPVGRVEQYVLHPLDFEEFLVATGKEMVVKELSAVPVREHLHPVLLELFQQYVIIGGMPEVVKQYAIDKSMANLAGIYDSLWTGFSDDAEKYARNSSEAKIIRHIMSTAPAEQDRISFACFGHSNYRSREVGEAFRALHKARIIQLIYPSFNQKPPLVPVIKRKPRLQFLDTGLLNHALGIQPVLLGLSDLNDLYKGRILQHVILQQFIALHSSPLFTPVFWTRESTTSSAEVDLVVQHNQFIMPVEVKSGKQGMLKSLHQFMETAEHPYAIRLLANRQSIEEVITRSGKKFKLLNLPCYLGSKIPEYIDWFTTNF